MPYFLILYREMSLTEDDAFADVSYERLNRIRITDAKLSGKNVSITADLTAAYEPEIGVKKFTGNFVFTSPDRFSVRDEVETARPTKITAYLHSDNKIEKLLNQTFAFEPNGTYLSAEISTTEKLLTEVEKNILTAPGRPGSVDKGEREERGVRLAVSTEEKVLRLIMSTKLLIRKK